ncbi:MAG TPA: PaaI family thioesterase [Egibacteraceae bacterium]|nr:PaaI family thioesterase [Egibacteraceae bacterium]
MNAWPDDDAWRMPAEPGAGGEGFGRLVAAVRDLQDAITAARLSSPEAHAVAARLEAVLEDLDAFAVPEELQIAGRRPDLPGRGQFFAPVIRWEVLTGEGVTAWVRFGRYYLGANSAAHGGAIPLVFDEVMGEVANRDRPRSRTAYLKVDYRRITPVGRDLRVEAAVVRQEGRKRFVEGAIYDDADLLCEATALFVELRPGQP